MKSYGIPEGSPISDLIANIYMIDFDTAIKQLVDTCGGHYYRYSDDILIIVPLNVDAIKLEESVRQAIEKYGKKLRIKEEKSSVFQFEAQGAGQTCKLVKVKKGKNGLEYLGFGYDENKIHLRDSTLANLRRKTIRATRYHATVLANRYPDKNSADLLDLFNVDHFIQEFAKVENFETKKDDYRNWTFWTYLTRSRKILGNLGHPILKQIKSNRKIIERSIKEEIVRAVAQRR